MRRPRGDVPVTSGAGGGRGERKGVWGRSGRPRSFSGRWEGSGLAVSLNTKLKKYVGQGDGAGVLWPEEAVLGPSGS